MTDFARLREQSQCLVMHLEQLAKTGKATTPTMYRQYEQLILELWRIISPSGHEAMRLRRPYS